MNVKLLLEKVFDLLPEEVIKDLYFTKLKDNILSNCIPSSFLIGHISVSQDIYDKIDTEYAEHFLVGKGILKLVFFGKSMVALDIKCDYDRYLLIKLKMTNPNREARTFLYKTSGLSRLESTIINGDGSEYQDYVCDISYYDEHYNLLDINTESEKDECFSEEFSIPIFLARYLRTNFSSLAKEISTLSAKLKLKEEDDSVTEEMFLFRPPFILANLKEFINLEFENEIRIFTDNEEYPYKMIETKVLDNIIKNLLQQIGNDGEVVISDNIFETLNMAIIGMIPMVYTTGLILKKSLNLYTLYYVHIEDNEVIAIPQELSFEEVKELFNKNANNQNVPGLNAFFGINRGI